MNKIEVRKIILSPQELSKIKEERKQRKSDEIWARYCFYLLISSLSYRRDGIYFAHKANKKYILPFFLQISQEYGIACQIEQDKRGCLAKIIDFSTLPTYLDDTEWNIIETMALMVKCCFYDVRSVFVSDNFIGSFFAKIGYKVSDGKLYF